MRILLCLNRDFISNLALNQLRPALDGHVFDIVLSNGIGRKTVPKAAEIEAWGNLEKMLMEDNLFPLLEQRDPAGDHFQSFRQLALPSKSGAIREFFSINEGEGLAYVQKFQPDVIISIRFGQIFKTPVIAIPRLGILNLHSGILPAYRGILATFWAMLHHETEMGSTLHYVTDGTVDTGPIIAIYRVPIDKKKSLLWNIASLYKDGTTGLANTLAMLSTGKKIDVSEQPVQGGNYYTYPTSQDIAAFLKQGRTLYSQEDYKEFFQAHYDVIL